MTEEKKHSEIPPSGSERWLNCPGSVKLSRECPPQEESPAATEGITAHGFLEQWLNRIKKYPESNWLSIAPKDLKIKIASDMMPSIKLAVEHVLSVWNPKESELQVEQKVVLDHIHPELRGTADITIAEPYGLLYVPDYKHGRGHKVKVSYQVDNRPRAYNTQLMIYLIGVAKKFHYEFTQFRIGVIQPRASVRDPIRTADITIQEIKQHEEYFKRGVDRVYSAKPSLFMGDWCYFCPAKERNCPLQKKQNVAKTEKYFKNVN